MDCGFTNSNIFISVRFLRDGGADNIDNRLLGPNIGNVAKNPRVWTLDLAQIFPSAFGFGKYLSQIQRPAPRIFRYISNIRTKTIGYLKIYHLITPHSSIPISLTESERKIKERSEVYLGQEWWL